MTDKTEEQTARDKAAVEAMRNAKANMGTALDRVDKLERALQNAIYALHNAKKAISPTVYAYHIEGRARNETIHSQIDASIAAAQAHL